MLVLNDFRQAVRPLFKRPWQSVVIFLILTVGIGMGSAFYSAAEAMFLRPLPFDRENRLVSIEEILKTGNKLMDSAPDLDDVREQSRMLVGVAAYQGTRGTILVNGAPEYAEGMTVDRHFFPLLGVSPRIGRGFTAEDQQDGAPLSIILSYRYWQRRFAGDQTVLGKNIILDKGPCTVIGVMPRSFSFPFLDQMEVDFWLPLRTQYMGRYEHDKYGIARLKDGVSLQQAQAEAALIALRIDKARPEDDFSFHLRIYRGVIVEELRPLLLILGGIMVCLLLVVCINVASLLLVEAVRCRKEVEIRFALGGTRWKIARLFLLRALVLAFAGGIAGAGLAGGLIVLLRNLLPAGFPGVDQITLNISLLGFTILVSLGTGIFFGLWPALAATRKLHKLSLNQASQAAQQSVRGRSMQRSRRRLVVLQLAFSSGFLVVMALLAISFYHLLNVDLGIRLDHRLLVSVTPTDPGLKTEGVLQQFYSHIREQLLAIPGVDAVTVSSDAPLTAHGERDFRMKGMPAPKDSREWMADVETVGANYFEELGMAVLKGRSFTDEDRHGGTPVAIVNEAFAKRFFGKVSPLGKQICIPTGDCPWREIVGIVADARDSRIDGPFEPAYFVPFWQAQPGFLSEAAFTVHTPLAPASVLESIRKEVLLESVSRAGVAGPVTMEEMRSRQLAWPRDRMWFLSVSTLLALFLASMGVYGVIAGDVEQRRREIGIRTALGASPQNIAALFQRQMFFMLIPGLVIGLTGAALIVRSTTSMLFGTTPIDPVAYFGAALVLSVVAAMSTALPVRRALRESTAEVLRAE
ncbi:MAG: ABC transporter permease [Candidatus Angelobacter sp.]